MRLATLCHMKSPANTAQRLQLSEADARVRVNAAVLMLESDTSDSSDLDTDVASNKDNVSADGTSPLFESSASSDGEPDSAAVQGAEFLLSQASEARPAYTKYSTDCHATALRAMRAKIVTNARSVHFGSTS